MAQAQKTKAKDSARPKDLQEERRSNGGGGGWFCQANLDEAPSKSQVPIRPVLLARASMLSRESY